MLTAAATAALVASALADGIRPDRRVGIIEWSKENIVVADGPKAGSPWDPDESPYIAPILEELAPESPNNLVVVRKSAQTGYTTAGICWLGYIIDVTPAASMFVSATINAVQDFNREKLQPVIDASEALVKRVSVQKTRSGNSSTKVNKRFPGGSLTLTGANSTADLRGGTKKYIVCDEIDEWDEDLNGQGDPMEMVDARQMAFHASGEYKKLVGSTPTIKGSSRIDHLFEAGDQRYLHVPCPHCGEYQRLVFSGLKFSKTYPHNAHYPCVECGAIIEHHHKKAMVKKGRFIAENPGPGRHPSFHIDTLISPFTTWDHLAEKFIKAQNDVSKLKTFVNLWLGESWEARGDAPEWQRLLSRRDEYEMGRIPAGGLILTGASDVQKDGIYYEIIAWGEGKISWSIDRGFLLGETADENGGVWKQLDALRHRQYVNAYGNKLGIDIYGIDCKYNSQQVYRWARRHPHTFPVRGTHRWSDPAIGSPAATDINNAGQKRRRGMQIWPIGSYSLKAQLYANLRKDGMRDGEECDPEGFCHFSRDHDEHFFKQLTAEYLSEKKKKDGRTIKEWVARGPNHYHDCRIYNMGIAEHPLIRLSQLSDDDWMQLRRVRDVQPSEIQQELFKPTNEQPKDNGYLGERSGNWLG